MSNNSRTCCSKRTGRPLKEYYSEYEASEAADYANSVYEKNMEPYLCKRCGFWHLSPKDRHTPCEKCFSCTDGRGRCKMLYYDKGDAERRANIIYQEEGQPLRVYPCPYDRGWHLTKQLI